jgi:hypothetical protein
VTTDSTHSRKGCARHPRLGSPRVVRGRIPRGHPVLLRRLFPPGCKFPVLNGLRLCELRGREGPNARQKYRTGVKRVGGSSLRQSAAVVQGEPTDTYGAITPTIASEVPPCPH